MLCVPLLDSDLCFVEVRLDFLFMDIAFITIAFDPVWLG